MAETYRNTATLVLGRAPVTEKSEHHGIGIHFQPQQPEKMRFGLSAVFPDGTETLQICSYFSLMNDNTSSVMEEQQTGLCRKAC